MPLRRYLMALALCSILSILLITRRQTRIHSDKDGGFTTKTHFLFISTVFKSMINRSAYVVVHALLCFKRFLSYSSKRLHRYKMLLLSYLYYLSASTNPDIFNCI